MKHKIYLYIKTHNITKLSYFGKTTASDPHKYRGSGKYWKRHIKKYGYDVTTTIIGTYVDENECNKDAIEFSLKHNIVESKDWANFKIENGLDGGFTHLNDGSKEHKQRCSKAGIKCHELHKQLANNNFTKGHSEEAVKKSLNTKLEKYGVDYFKKIASHPLTAEHKKKISDSLKLRNSMRQQPSPIKGIKREKITCPHCNKQGAKNTMVRFHFDNCKNFISQ